MKKKREGGWGGSLCCGGIFRPARLALTLFVSSARNDEAENARENAIEAARRAFKTTLTNVGVLTCRRNAGNERCDSVYDWTSKIDYDLECCRHRM
jgi:hypothetical protein